eukprot:g67973.t1
MATVVELSLWLRGWVGVKLTGPRARLMMQSVKFASYQRASDVSQGTIKLISTVNGQADDLTGPHSPAAPHGNTLDPGP